MIHDAVSHLSPHNPSLQIAWDATSFRALMECPRKYQLSILEGWRSAGFNADLEYGGFYASSMEVYKKGRANGLTKKAATIQAVRHAIESTWNREEGVPWGGRYEELWQCTGVQPFKNARGNRAKCPYSHKGAWFPAPSPGTCGSCGSPCESQRTWIGNHNYKDRISLVRAVIWYCDTQPDAYEDGPMVFVFPNGKPAVEHSFRMELLWASPGVGGKAGPSYILCGHLDSVMIYGEELFIDDNKTTTKALNTRYFAQHAPNIQMDTYDYAGANLFKSLDIKGVMIEGTQVTKEGVEFALDIKYRTDALRREYERDLRYWLDQAEQYARDNYWPMNRASCFLCEFKTICTKEPSTRQRYLEENFVKRPWNPLKER